MAILEAKIPTFIVPLLSVLCCVLYASKIPDKQRKHANTSNASSRKYRNRRVSEILYLYLVLSHVQTQGVIEAGILPALATLLLNTKKCIKKEACWVVSNIAAGTRAQVAAIIQNEIIPPLVSCLAPRNDTEVRKEACWGNLQLCIWWRS